MGLNLESVAEDLCPIHIAAPLSAISITTLFSQVMMSIEYARNPVIVIDEPQSAHTYPLS
jgi:hypothetical protein